MFPWPCILVLCFIPCVCACAGLLTSRNHRVSVRQLTSVSRAGLVNAAVVTPVELVRSRLMVQYGKAAAAGGSVVHEGPVSVIRHVVAQRGITGGRLAVVKLVAYVIASPRPSGIANRLVFSRLIVLVAAKRGFRCVVSTISRLLLRVFRSVDTFLSALLSLRCCSLCGFSVAVP